MGQDILTGIVKQFLEKALLAPSVLSINARSLLAILIVIDLTILYILTLLNEENGGYKELLKQTPLYGAYIYLVMNYSQIVMSISQSFFKAGVIAGGSTLSESDFTNPSNIINYGYNVVGPVWENYLAGNGSLTKLLIKLITEISLPGLTQILSAVGITEKTSAILGLFTILIASVLIMICFFILAAQLFVVQIEFAVIASLGIILVPFGVWDKTRFIFDKIKSSIINFGIKLMLLTSFSGVSLNIIKQITLPTEPTWQQMFYFLLGIGAIAYLSVGIPKMVDKTV